MNERAAMDQGQHNLEALNLLVAEIWKGNAFYGAKWRAAGLREEPLESLEDLARLPFTTRAELEADQRANPPLGANLTRTLGEYRRVHRSSGSSGSRLFWADTAQSWEWLLERSAAAHRLAGVTASDRAYFALSFGASLGSWVVYEGAWRVGCACVAGGTAADEEDLRWLLAWRPTVVVGRASGLLALAGRLEERGTRPSSIGVKKLVMTGDPREQISLVRTRLADRWGAEVFERYGLTEAGTVAGECPAHPDGLHLEEGAFLAEVIDPWRGAPAPEGGVGELVLTTLGRTASPIVRYRTGDLTRLLRGHRCGCGRLGTLLGEVRRGPLGQGSRGDGSENAARAGNFPRPHRPSRRFEVKEGS